jgi:hypothetical protein
MRTRQPDCQRVYDALAGMDETKRLAATLAVMDLTTEGIDYRGDRASGIVIDHRHPDSWLVSFRPTGPDRDGSRYYRNPVDAARAAVDGRHGPSGERRRP